MSTLTVRPMEPSDVEAVVAYWAGSEAEHLRAMGVDLARLPPAEAMTAGLGAQLELPIEERASYALIWLADGVAIGHCNTNPTAYGVEAFMHLHLWSGARRGRGLGLELLRQSVPEFFRALGLKRLISQPYALNPAPNRVLPKAGFRLVREYVTTPGSINFEQPVKRWEIERNEVPGLD